MVAFVSTATNVVNGQSDGNGASDIFVFDRSSDELALVSHTANGASTTGNGASYFPAISPNGAYVAFVSTASNLASGQTDTNNDADVFLYERATGRLIVVSHAASTATTAAKGFSTSPLVSTDGSWVSFMSNAPDLVAGQSDTNNHFDIFLFERATGTLSLVSHAPGSANTAAGLASQSHSMSADASFALFTSAATNLVAGQSDTNGDSDVFLFERATGNVTLVSHAPSDRTTAANKASSGYFKPTISASGGVVVFESRATNLVPGQVDNNADVDTFLFDRSTGIVTLVSHVAASAVTTPNDASYQTAASADGAVVGFRSEATNVVTGQADFAGTNDIFMYERATGGVTLLSHTPTSATTSANALSTTPVVSANGAFVAFQSYSSNVVAGQSDTNDRTDVFLHERATGTRTLVSHVPDSPTTTGSASSHSPSVSTDGSVVVYQSDATNLVTGPNDGNGASDVFLTHRAPGRAPVTDFNGDGSTDVGVFRPVGGAWMVRDGLTTTFGVAGDIPVAGDYDADGATDIAVYRPAGRTWFVEGGTAANWGTEGDLPVAADYDGDSRADIAVFRQLEGVWLVRGGATLAFGTYGDIPVPDDYDGDGDTEFAVFRPINGMWFFRNGPAATQYGMLGDLPVPGDYDGDGDAEVAVFRPSTGTWFVQNGPAVQFGAQGDIPVPGDYDGDGSTDIAVFRPSTGAWYFHEGTAAHFGGSGDVPLELPIWVQFFLSAVVQ
ncbi:MAG: hypothetical protein M3179_04150 [Actinomycetota bacterium]|nr:hypothetical protein [Actinomycetota bacterium]